MRTPQWLAAVVVLALAVGGCESTRTQTTVDTIRLPPRTFTSGDLSFRYTPAWEPTPPLCVPPLPAGAPYTLVYLSNEPLTATLNPPCGHPTGALKAGTIRVQWWTQRPLNPEARVSITPPVTTAVVAGHVVTEKSGPTAACAGLRSDTTIRAVIDAGSTIYGFDACIRGPGVASNRRAVQDMLQSVVVRAAPPVAPNARDHDG